MAVPTEPCSRGKTCATDAGDSGRGNAHHGLFSNDEKLATMRAGPAGGFWDGERSEPGAATGKRRKLLPQMCKLQARAGPPVKCASVDRAAPTGYGWRTLHRGSEPEARMAGVSRGLAIVELALALTGCSIIPFYTRANERFSEDTKPTRATREITVKDLPNGVFVGIAISGGGSRAANFSAAVLFELEELGLLQTVSAISSISGGSLTAAYYGLFGHDAERWKRERVRTLLGKDFQTRWVLRWFLPHNVVRYWLTDFDRSDIMEGVFD